MGNETDGIFLKKSKQEDNINSSSNNSETDGIFLKGNSKNSTRIELSELTRRSLNSTRNTRYTRDSTQFITIKEDKKNEKDNK